MAKGVSMVVEDLRSGAWQGRVEEPYRIVKVINSTWWIIGQCLSKEYVNNIIADGVTVTIVPTKK